MLLGRKVETINGIINGDGDFNGKPTGLSLHVNSGNGGESNPAGYWISCSLSGPNGSTEFQCYHAAYAPTQLASEAGRYTILLAGTSTSASIPQGTGYAFAAVAKTGGSVTIRGKLADGTAFSSSGVLVSGSNGNQLLVFDSSLYSGKGLFAGSVAFEHLTDSDCDGIMEWVRPANRGGVFYAHGFDANLDLMGSLYVTPARGTILPLFLSGNVTLNNGGLDSPIGEPVTVSPAGVFVVSGPNPIKLKLNVTTATGAIAGSFLYPITSKTVLFSGVLYQNPNALGAGGFFIGPVLSGTESSGNMTLSQ